MYILKSKDETFVRFKELKTIIERQTRKKVKRIRTDIDFEYFSEQFNKLCADEGIARDKIVRGTPQQNSLAERMNETILERVRCMIINVGLPKSFWREAVVIAYI